MKTAVEVSPAKLRGGFYTPAPLVDFCLERLAALSPVARPRVLEPSAGDGAFLRGMLDRWPGPGSIDSVTAVEISGAEVEKCRLVLDGRPGEVIADSVLSWALEQRDAYDAAVGNPPFVRFQFVSAEDRLAAEALSLQVGVSARGVANLWIPVLLAALHRLRAGGAFSFVVPTEVCTGASAGHAREWLLRNTAQLRLDLFPPGSFPRVLQEVAVLSGVRSSPSHPTLSICQHRRDQTADCWTVDAPQDRRGWTGYLLETRHRDALASVVAREDVHPLGELAAFEVSIVTGANAFFSVDDATAETWDLDRWCEPLLPRIRHAPGLTFTPDDHESMRDGGFPAWLLNFGPDHPDPQTRKGSAAYLLAGESQQLHRRFKCRIREPWYRVPNFQRGELLLSKRSHVHPRVVINEAGVYTTDTIYRGRLLAGAPSAPAIAAVFHNSLTLLTAEIEGRSFGGGVLELVPSEVARLLLPVCVRASAWLPRLDRIARTAPEQALVTATDAALVQDGAFDADAVALLAEARQLLLDRRLERGTQSRTDTEGYGLAA